jgi:hypothetical protein
MAVNTTKVTDRRTVHYDSLQDLQRDAEQLAAGPVRMLGNKSYGQILRHLSIVMNGSIDGFPNRAPWFIRLIVRLMKKRILSKTMSAGFKLPADAEAALWPPGPEVAEGLEELHKAIRRLQTETKREPSPFLGPLTREEWDQLHLRHAELHMSFVTPASAAV